MLPKLLMLACFAALGYSAENSPKVFPYPYSQEDLPNGLRLVTVTTDLPNIVSTYIVVQTGSRNEVEPGHTGFAHFFEHMMFRGTDKYPPEKYNDTLRAMGAASNAYTTDDYTCYHTTFSKPDLETVLAMEADRFQNLKYAEPEFKTEALAILGEYNKNSANPYRKIDEVLSETAFTQHTYKHTTMGFLKDIQDMPNQYDYSKQFFGRYYRPEYTTLLVVGDLKPKAVRDLVDKYWGPWKRGEYKSEIPQEPAQQEPRANKVAWPVATLPILTIAFHAPAYTDTAKDTAALDAVAFLGFSPNSELYQKLVIQEQKVDTLFASAPQDVDASLFMVSARVKDPKDVDYVQQQILATVASFQGKPVETARLDTVRKHLRYKVALQMDSNDAIAEVLAEYIALKRTPESMNRFFDQYAQLTPADVQHAASEYLAPKNRTIVTLSGPGGVQ